MAIIEHHYQIGETADAKLRGPEREPGFLLAVTDRGLIKTLRYSTNGMSSKLQAKRIVVNKRTVALQFVNLTDEARRMGWQLLEELYEQEETVRVQDCLAVYDWYRQVSYRKSGIVRPLDPIYLPDGIDELKESAGNVLTIEMPAPERRRVSKAEEKRRATRERKAAEKRAAEEAAGQGADDSEEPAA